MSDGQLDEHLFTFSKAGEFARGDFDDGSLSSFAGLLEDDRNGAMTWLDQFDEFRSSSLHDLLLKESQSEAMARAMSNGDAALAAYLQGVTEQEVPASQLSLALALMKRLDNHAAPCFLTVAGNPETGKTNSVSLVAELRAEYIEAHRERELMVVSNIRDWEGCDATVTSMHELMATLIRYRQRPKFVAIDEVSTHMDARTSSHEVATQWTPAAKRFAKLNVDTCAIIGHTGKDIHPEAKRLTTTAMWKETQKKAHFFDNWDDEEDRPDGQLFGGPIHELEPTSHEYLPNDPAPWSWDLDPDLYDRDFDWHEFLTHLCDNPPQ